jgi:aryl-alcohol dehydrogenase
MKIMAALSHGADTPFEIAEVDLDEPRDDEVLVAVAAAGVCHTDLTMRARWPAAMAPIVLGHEGAGTVVAVGAAVTRARVGDRVLMSYRSCEACAECTAGHPPYCHAFPALNTSGSRPDGSTTMRRDGAPVYGSFFGQSSFASHALAYETNVVVIGADVDPSIAAPLGCSVQTGAGAVLNVLQPGIDASLVVFGAGGVGLSAVMAARATGVSTIVAVDPVADRRGVAAQLGATATIDPTDDDVVDAIRELTGDGATHAVDTTANGTVINQAVTALARRGTLALVGIGGPQNPLDVGNIVSGGKTVRGVIEGDAVPQDFVPRLLALHADGRLPLEKLVRTYAFDDIDTAAAEAARGTTVKPVLHV